MTRNAYVARRCSRPVMPSTLTDTLFSDTDYCN